MSQNTPKKNSEITTIVLNKVNQFAETGELKLPKDYSAANALKSAMLVLTETVDKNKKPVLEVCSKESIANALLKMVVEGLSPLKTQCYFIAHGNELTFFRSYQGSIALAKRLGAVKDVVANVIYKGDDFAFSVDINTGRKQITKHEQKLENIANENIIGAYAVIIYEGYTDLEVMTLAEITQAWKQGYGYGKSQTHSNFTQEMAKKTVINRACKAPINSSTDANLVFDDEAPVATTEVEDVEAEVVNETASQPLEIEEAKEEKNAVIDIEIHNVDKNDSGQVDAGF